MAGRIAYYGNIVTNGLVLNLDAGKKDSYPGSGTTWRDISGNNISGSLVNGPTFSSANAGSIVLDGSNDYVLTAGFSFIPTIVTPHSGFCWIYVKSYAVGSIWQYGQTVDNLYATGVGMNAGGNLGWPYNGGGLMYQVSTLQIPLNTWAFVGIVKTSTTLTYYLNTSVDAKSESGAGTLGSNNPISIGIGWTGLTRTGAYLNANVASTQIYNRALSSTEVLQNYNALKGRYGL